MLCALAFLICGGDTYTFGRCSFRLRFFGANKSFWLAVKVCICLYDVAFALANGGAVIDVEAGAVVCPSALVGHGHSSLMVSSAFSMLDMLRFKRCQCAELGQWPIGGVVSMLLGTNARADAIFLTRSLCHVVHGWVWLLIRWFSQVVDSLV